MKESNLSKADLITSIVLIAFGISVLVISLRMPTLVEQSGNIFVAPGIVPGLIGVIITILSLALFVRSLQRKGFQLGIRTSTVKALLFTEQTSRMLKTIILCILYALLLGDVHFIILTTVFIFFFVLTFEYDLKAPFGSQIRKVVAALILSILTAGIVFGVFVYIFLVHLP